MIKEGKWVGKENRAEIGGHSFLLSLLSSQLQKNIFKLIPRFKALLVFYRELWFCVDVLQVFQVLCLRFGKRFWSIEKLGLIL